MTAAFISAPPSTAGLGPDRVFDCLDQAYAAPDVHLVFLTVEGEWDRYRADPRFGALLARGGFTSGPGPPERPSSPQYPGYPLRAQMPAYQE